MPEPLCSTALRSTTCCFAFRTQTSWLSVAKSIPTKYRYCSDNQPPWTNLSVTQHQPCTGASRANSPRDVLHGPHRKGARPPQALCRSGQLALPPVWSASYWLAQFGSGFKGTGVPLHPSPVISTAFFFMRFSSDEGSQIVPAWRAASSALLPCRCWLAPVDPSSRS